MIDFEKFVKYSKPGPRYTSYPTAVEFTPNFNAQTYASALEKSNTTTLKNQKIPLSIYVHLPFCRSACYFCGCNVIYTSKEDKKTEYISYFKRELELLKRHIDTSREVVQFHFGGGTPTFFSAQELSEVINSVRDTFTNFATNAEISCEIDPRYFTREQMQTLKNGGFNRLSFGVQDFEARVQEAIHRIQPFEMTQNAINLAREFGINSVNFDLIYGLPFQNLQTFTRTIEKVLTLSPERLAIFNYAHIPWMKKTMRKIDESTLPKAKEKLEILRFCIEKLTNSGYEMIGMDHFAKTSDELAKAKNAGQLRRNFQGYTTRGFSQTIGIGLTSISEGLDYYAQNFKDMGEYKRAIDSGVLPTERGVALSDEDILRKAVIMELMNNLRLDFQKIEQDFGIDFRAHFARELDELKPLEDADLLKISESGIQTTQTGAMLIRNIAMVFDAYMAKNVGEKRFSKTI